jgi:hypothetical protein
MCHSAFFERRLRVPALIEAVIGLMKVALSSKIHLLI